MSRLVEEPLYAAFFKPEKIPSRYKQSNSKEAKEQRAQLRKRGEVIWGLVGWHIGMSDAVEWFGGLEEAMESDFEDYVYLHSINNCSE